MVERLRAAAESDAVLPATDGSDSSLLLYYADRRPETAIGGVSLFPDNSPLKKGRAIKTNFREQKSETKSETTRPMVSEKSEKVRKLKPLICKGWSNLENIEKRA